MNDKHPTVEEQAPIPNWTEPVDGVIHVPDELDKLVNSIAHYVRCHTISGVGEVETVCRIAYCAQKFFHASRNSEVEALQSESDNLRNIIKMLKEVTIADLQARIKELEGNL